MNDGTCTGESINLYVDGGSSGSVECFTHARMSAARPGFEIDPFVMGSGEIDKCAPRADAVENS